MPLPDHEGRYQAQLADWAVKYKEGQDAHGRAVVGRPYLEALFQIVAEIGTAGEWVDCSGKDFSIRGFFHLFRTDGSRLEFVVDELVEALNWDGQDLVALDSTDWSKTAVQIEVKFEVYQGENRLRVAHVRPADYVPGVKRLEPQKLKSLAAQWNGKLRAGVSKVATARTQARPATAPQRAVENAPTPDEIVGEEAETAVE
jgi:hypothetical protein